MKVSLAVRRQGAGDLHAWTQTFHIECERHSTLLDCLEGIAAEHDPSLCFRDNCFSGVCGECGMRANGNEVLACRLRMDGIPPDSAGAVNVGVEPLRFHRVIRDLVVDRGDHFRRLLASAALFQPNGGDISDEEAAVLRRTTRCLHCGLCVSACEAYPGHSDFAGPAAMAWLKRFLDDPRDGAHAQRRELAASAAGVQGCVDCGACDPVCPESVNPYAAIRSLR